MRDKLENKNSGFVTVVSWNYHHGNRHCVSETVRQLQKLGLLKRLISNKYEVYDSNLKRIKPNKMYPVKMFYLVLRVKYLIFGNYKKTQFREWLFDYFAVKNLGRPNLIYLDADRFPFVTTFAKNNNILTLCYQRTAHVNYISSVLEEERKKRDYDTGYLDNGIKRRRLRCIENADFILAHSEFVKDTDIANGLNEKGIKVVYGCVDTNLYSPSDIQKSDPVIILFTGYDPLLKGLFYLLEAWNIIQKKIDNAELWLVGKDQKEVCDQYVGLERVRSIGYQEDMVPIYQKASILVQPSLVDAGPKVVTEGMSTGLPVIVSNAIGYSEIIENNVNGYVVPARNHVELAEKIEYCIKHPDKLQKMGRNARLRVKKLSHKYHAYNVIDSIQSILKSGTLSI